MTSVANCFKLARKLPATPRKFHIPAGFFVFLTVLGVPTPVQRAQLAMTAAQSRSAAYRNTITTGWQTTFVSSKTARGAQTGGR